MVFKGFRFGMLLQLAVGPVCLYIFRTSALGGFAEGLSGTAGVAAADGLYIAAAIAGIAAVLGRKNVRAFLRYFGAIVLCLFGASTILGQFGIAALPALSLGSGAGGAFIGALLLTASNPLTILFWAGVFSGKVAELDMRKKDIWLFGLGALMATPVFLTAVAAAGSLTGSLLPGLAILILNVAVGILLIFFGIRMVLHKKPDETHQNQPSV